MKRFLLQTAMLAGATFGVMAENAVLDFSYASGELFSYGKGKKEIVDVAICINDPGLAGMKLVSFQAYINTTENISETSLWLTKELTLVDKVNVPDIASFDVTPVEGVYGDEELAVMSITLDQPYELDGEPLYLGYSLTVDDLDDASRYPIILANNVNPNGLFVRLSKSVLKWKEYSSTANGVALIVAQLEGDVPAYSLGIKSAAETYVNENEDFSMVFSVSNFGANAVNTIDYTYTIDGGEENVGSVTLPAAIEPNLTSSTELLLPFNPVSGLGKHEIEVNLGTLNNEPNSSPASSYTATINVVPFTPVHRPLVEEFTGLWCGWCTRGYFAMETIKEYYDDDEVSICYHNGDAMAVTNSYPVNITGFPSASIDRLEVLDPYYGASNAEFGIIDYMLNIMDQFTIADIDVDAEIEDGKVNITSTAKFVQDIDNSNYQIGYVLVCNGLYNESWAQQNYYYNESGYAGSPLEILTTWPSPVYDLIFNDVAVDVKGMMGVSGSLPSTIKLGEEYTHTYSYNIANNSLIQDEKNLVVAAFIVNTTTGKVINANKWSATSSGETAVKELSKEAQVVESEYFDLMGRKVSNARNGLFIKIDKLNDGTTRSSKVMLNK